MATTGTTRSALAPDIPTLKEAGVDFELIAWQGLVAPAGTDPAIVKRIFDALKAAYDTPEVRKRYGALGFEVDFSQSSEQYATFIKSEVVKWGDMVTAAGIQPQ
jgi:tripartite-type tricarboxylate transporter receptor subunit TctC